MSGSAQTSIIDTTRLQALQAALTSESNTIRADYEKSNNAPLLREPLLRAIISTVDQLQIHVANDLNEVEKYTLSGYISDIINDLTTPMKEILDRRVADGANALSGVTVTYIKDLKQRSTAQFTTLNNQIKVMKQILEKSSNESKVFEMACLGSPLLCRVALSLEMANNYVINTIPEFRKEQAGKAEKAQQALQDFFNSFQTLVSELLKQLTAELTNLTTAENGLRKLASLVNEHETSDEQPTGKLARMNTNFEALKSKYDAHLELILAAKQMEPSNINPEAINNISNLNIATLAKNIFKLRNDIEQETDKVKNAAKAAEAAKAAKAAEAAEAAKAAEAAEAAAQSNNAKNTQPGVTNFSRLKRIFYTIGNFFKGFFKKAILDKKATPAAVTAVSAAEPPANMEEKKIIQDNTHQINFNNSLIENKNELIRHLSQCVTNAEKLPKCDQQSIIKNLTDYSINLTKTIGALEKNNAALNSNNMAQSAPHGTVRNMITTAAPAIITSVPVNTIAPAPAASPTASDTLKPPF